MLKAELNQVKHRISCEVLSRFPLPEIRIKAFDNLARWKSQGTWGQAYDDWLDILENGDDLMLTAAMIGSSERSEELRQSMPYVGMLDQALVAQIHADAPKKRYKLADLIDEMPCKDLPKVEGWDSPKPIGREIW